MTLEWRETFSWDLSAIRATPMQWELYDEPSTYAVYGRFCGYVHRSDSRRYVAVSNCAGLPQPTKTFRSLKQAKAWVQALAVLNQ